MGDKLRLRCEDGVEVYELSLEEGEDEGGPERKRKISQVGAAAMDTTVEILRAHEENPCPVSRRGGQANNQLEANQETGGRGGEGERGGSRERVARSKKEGGRDRRWF